MHFHGYVFANEPKLLMDSLIHFNGEPPAEEDAGAGDDTARSGPYQGGARGLGARDPLPLQGRGLGPLRLAHDVPA